MIGWDYHINPWNVIFTTTLFGIVLTVLVRQFRWAQAKIAEMRAELPGAIVGELITREEFVELWNRVTEAEAKLEHVEARLDKHITICNGANA